MVCGSVVDAQRNVSALAPFAISANAAAESFNLCVKRMCEPRSLNQLVSQ